MDTGDMEEISKPAAGVIRDNQFCKKLSNWVFGILWHMLLVGRSRM